MKHVLNNPFSSLGRFFLQTLLVAHPVNKFPAFYKTKRFITLSSRFHSRHLPRATLYSTHTQNSVVVSASMFFYQLRSSLPNVPSMFFFQLRSSLPNVPSQLKSYVHFSSRSRLLHSSLNSPSLDLISLMIFVGDMKYRQQIHITNQLTHLQCNKPPPPADLHM